VAWTSSRIDATGRPFARLAPLRFVGSVGFHPKGPEGWEAGLRSRGASRVEDDGTGSEVPGAVQWDLYGHLRVLGGTQAGQGVGLAAELANLFDRRIEMVRHFPLPGRTFTLSLDARF
jgi:hypothetical protein